MYRKNMGNVCQKHYCHSWMCPKILLGVGQLFNLSYLDAFENLHG